MDVKSIKTTRAFSHANPEQGVHGIDIPPGTYDVGVINDPGNGEICARAAEIAIDEGWGEAVKGKGGRGTGRQSRGSGQG